MPFCGCAPQRSGGRGKETGADLASMAAGQSANS
jgi:hypothetical protein